MLDPEALADENYVTVPRGGPIYISDMVGPLTKVADFEVSIFHELEVWSCFNFGLYWHSLFEAFMPSIDSMVMWTHTCISSLMHSSPGSRINKNKNERKKKKAILGVIISETLIMVSILKILILLCSASRQSCPLIHWKCLMMRYRKCFLYSAPLWC